MKPTITSQRITEEQLENLLVLAERATPRPWWNGVHHGELVDIQSFMAQCAAYYPNNETLYMVGAGPIPENGVADGAEQTLIPAITGNGETSEANMDYIVAACNALPNLIAEILRIIKREHTNCATIIHLRDELKLANAEIKRLKGGEG